MTGIKIIAIVVAMAWCFAAQAQRSANWYFGDHAGIRFTAAGVADLPGSALKTEEGCATISDTAGNLLFYTDGSTVYNRLHAVMPGGTGLMGNISSSQSSIIVPMPGSDSLYYIFTAAVPTFTARYYYNIVDMSAQGGMGEVIQKNTLVSNDMSSERITAVQHRNRRDFWIITNPAGSSIYKAYLLTSSGLQVTPSVTNIGHVPPSGFGMIKGSPDGQLLVVTASSSPFLPPPSAPSTQLFRFDPSSGYLSRPLSLYYPQSTYGCAFSPNSQRVYVTSGFPNPSIGGPFAQFTLSSYDSTDVRNSLYTFNVSTPGGWGDISLGPDSVLYISRCLEKKLSAVKNPNADGPSCNFVDVAVSLTGKGIFGLPNFYNNVNNPPFYIDVEQQGCLQFTFSFHTNYQGTGSYSWDFGDGHFSLDSAPVHTYVRNSNDSFLVSFYFKSSDLSVKANLQQWVTLPPKPKAVFNAQTNGCVGNNITLTNNSTGNGPLLHHWDFGDNTTSAQPLPVKNFTDSGSYTIRLSVVDSLGCLSDTARTSIAVNKKAIAAFSISADGCEGSRLVITDASYAWNSTIKEWQYDLGDGSFTGTAAPVTTTSFSSPGIYNTRLVTVSAEGCTSDTARQTVTIYEKPVAGFIMPHNCVTDLSSFTDTSRSGASVITAWQWNFDDPAAVVNTSNLQHPSHQYADARNYDVELIVTTDKGCKDTALQVFTVNGASPKAALSFLQDPVCSGSAAVLVNNSSVNFGKLTGLSIDWGSSISTDPAPATGKQYSHNYAVFGTPATTLQPLRLTVQSGASCISTLDTFLTLKAYPLLNFRAIAPVCANSPEVMLTQGTVTNNATGTGQYLGIGVRKDNLDNYFFAPAQVPGDKALVKYSFTTTGGCTADTTQTVTILPKPVVSAGQNKSVLSGQTVQLNGTIGGNVVRHQWQPSVALNDANTLMPMVAPVNDIIYTLVATSADGCIDSASVQVRVVQAISIPNAFSPNGDGVNDSWEITHLNRYPNPVVQVYDRWGRLVFQSTGYNDPWKGTTGNNVALPVGVYYYVISIQGETNKFTGWVTLLK